MTTGLQQSTLKVLKQFNKSFPQFYEQFVSNEIQVHNLQLAHKLYKTKRAVIDIKTEQSRSIINFAYRNQSFLLSDIFGVLAAYGLTIHNLNIYGQIKSPMLVFIKLIVSRGGHSLTKKTADNVARAIREALAGNFEVEEMLAVEFNLNLSLQNVETEFYIDPVFHLPALLLEAKNEPGLFYKVMYAIWQEDLLIVNANLLMWRGRTRLILYLLGPNESLIPEYLGNRIAESVKRRLISQ
jgi:UTP:GlnB (protein PII) uridylyltransferase